MASNSRRRSRILAFQILFEAEQHKRVVSAVLDTRIAESNLSDDGATFTRDLVNGVTAKRYDIDPVIELHAPAFPLKDMAPVDRNVLRLAIYEVLFDNRGAPLRVAINEAVEIAKGYGSESSGRFVNGVLGAVALEAAERNESANHESAS
jgi:N utilization substance protein B